MPAIRAVSDKLGYVLPTKVTSEDFTGLKSCGALFPHLLKRYLRFFSLTLFNLAASAILE